MKKEELLTIKKYFEERKAKNRKSLRRMAVIVFILTGLFLFQIGVLLTLSEISSLSVLQILFSLIPIITSLFVAFQIETLKITDEQFLKLIEALEEK